MSRSTHCRRYRIHRIRESGYRVGDEEPSSASNTCWNSAFTIHGPPQLVGQEKHAFDKSRVGVDCLPQLASGKFSCNSSCR